MYCRIFALFYTKEDRAVLIEGPVMRGKFEPLPPLPYTQRYDAEAVTALITRVSFLYAGRWSDYDSARRLAERHGQVASNLRDMLHWSEEEQGSSGYVPLLAELSRYLTWIVNHAPISGDDRAEYGALIGKARARAVEIAPNSAEAAQAALFLRLSVVRLGMRSEYTLTSLLCEELLSIVQLARSKEESPERSKILRRAGVLLCHCAPSRWSKNYRMGRRLCRDAERSLRRFETTIARA